MLMDDSRTVLDSRNPGVVIIYTFVTSIGHCEKSLEKVGRVQSAHNNAQLTCTKFDLNI